MGYSLWDRRESERRTLSPLFQRKLLALMKNLADLHVFIYQLRVSHTPHTLTEAQNRLLGQPLTLTPPTS